MAPQDAAASRAEGPLLQVASMPGLASLHASCSGSDTAHKTVKQCGGNIYFEGSSWVFLSASRSSRESLRGQFSPGFSSRSLPQGWPWTCLRPKPGRDPSFHAFLGCFCPPPASPVASTGDLVPSRPSGLLRAPMGAGWPQFGPLPLTCVSLRASLGLSPALALSLPRALCCPLHGQRA